MFENIFHDNYAKIFHVIRFNLKSTINAEHIHLSYVNLHSNKLTMKPASMVFEFTMDG